MEVLIFLAGVAIGLFIGAASLLVIGSTAVLRERRKRHAGPTYPQRRATNIISNEEDW